MTAGRSLSDHALGGVVRTGLAGVLAAALPVSSASALSLSDCTRTTHISHGGEAFHRDLGEGRVAWLDWWSQEGMAHDIMVVDCAPGTALRARTAEENMTARPPFHRTEAVVDIIDQQNRTDRVFATLPRLAEALEKKARDITLLTLTDEPCACAALYPDARGDKTTFTLTDAG